MGESYDKDRVLKIAYSAALEKAKSGWVIAREGWHTKEQYVFLADEGTFRAKDYTTGKLEPFLVMRTASGKYVPWLCSQSDALASDWAAVSRAEVTRNQDRLEDRA